LLSLLAYALVDTYPSNVPEPIGKSDAPTESVPPTWFSESLVTSGRPVCKLRQGNWLVHRKPAENHSPQQPVRHCPGEPTWGRGGRRRSSRRRLSGLGAGVTPQERETRNDGESDET